jgi:glutamate-5-semialdehyde dehydrogenase
MEAKELMLKLGQQAKAAAQSLGRLSSRVKDDFLIRASRALEEERAALIEANRKDLAQLDNKGMPASLIDRLTINEARIKDMAQSAAEVATLADPVGQIVKMWRRPNGLKVGRMRIPLGVIGIIYEARPNVTVEAAGLCLKSGNAVILKGGREALNTNLAIGRIFSRIGREVGIPEAAIQVVPSPDRETVRQMLQLEQFIDLIIPRGGEELIRMVAENSRIPVVKHFKGVCHVFVDASADIRMAEEICFNAKVQRPGVCNAMETMLVHQQAASDFLPGMAARFASAGVELRGCPRTLALLPEIKPVNEDDWQAEYLDLILAVRVVKDMDEAVNHIAEYGSQHTEAIVTRDYANAQRFLEAVDSSVVLVNASTRFSDGFQLGLGAEVGISTSKIHAFGPMGLEELTTLKFIVLGDGQIRT